MSQFRGYRFLIYSPALVIIMYSVITIFGLSSEVTYSYLYSPPSVITFRIVVMTRGGTFLHGIFYLQNGSCLEPSAFVSYVIVSHQHLLHALSHLYVVTVL
jgi:hypothetical protein